jgi:Na+-driven multidrug efflux pump
VLLLIPLVLILPGFLGTKGVWISFPLADSGSFLLTLYLFRRELLNLAVSGPVAGD